MNDRDRILQEKLDAVAPHFVQSLDKTFNAAGRTKLPVKNGSAKPIPKNSILFSINGTGQVDFIIFNSK